MPAVHHVHFSGDDLLPSGIAHLQRGTDGLTWIAFPAVEPAGAQASIRNVACLVLLQLADGTIWHLKTTGRPWTPMRVRTASAVLAEHGVPGANRERLEQRMAFALEVPQVTIEQPVLAAADLLQWDVRRTAVALVARSMVQAAGAISVADAATQVADLERRFASELESGLRQFALGLEPEALEVATVDGRVDTWRYNYVVRGPGRSWRMQFARTFPLLLRAAATGPVDSAGVTLREAVAAGRPIVRHLARVWAVRPGAVRALVGCPAQLAGPRWEADPRTLVRLLDRIRPEDLPGEDADAWMRFNRCVDLAERIFRRPILSSFASASWLREAARDRFRVGAGVSHGQDLPAVAVTEIETLREQLIATLTGHAALACRAPGSEPRLAAAAVADRYLGAMRSARLAVAAGTFVREHARLLGESARKAREARVAAGLAYWPLMPADLPAANGACRVVALTTRNALVRLGARMSLCIDAGAELESRAAACERARLFLVAVVDAGSGVPRSVAEFRLRQPVRGGDLEPELVQHRGHGNSMPPFACDRALQELMAHVRTPAVQDHLHAGRSLAQRRDHASPEKVRADEAAMTASALQSALGATVFDAAAREVAEAASLTPGIGSGGAAARTEAPDARPA